MQAPNPAAYAARLATGPRTFLAPGRAGLARQSILSTIPIRRHFHTSFRSFARELSSLVGTIDKARPPDRSKEEAGAIPRGLMLVLPPCAILYFRQTGPGPGLPAGLPGATTSEN